jgi:cobalt-zinc-cadmium efflux system membrane fusion protein
VPLVAGLVAALVLVGLLVRGRGTASAKTESAPAKRDVPYLEGKAIAFSPGFRDRAGIKTVTVGRVPLTPVVKVVGTVSFDPEHVSAVGTRIRGFVRRVHKVEGDAVEKNEILAEIESAELGQAQADVAVAVANKRAADLNNKREEDLAAKNLTTAREAEVAKATLDQQAAMLNAARQRVAALGGDGAGQFGVYFVRAPLKGTVVERHVAAGQSVEGNLIAMRVANLDQLWIELSVFERDIGAIRTHDTVEIITGAEGSQRIQGRVAHVGEVISLETRSADVRVEVDNKTRALRPGQSVRAAIHASGPARVVLSVPQSAITYVDGKATVFVAESDTRVVPTEVKLGGTDGSNQEILEGVKDGAVVVSDGVFALKSELFRLAAGSLGRLRAARRRARRVERQRPRAPTLSKRVGARGLGAYRC